MIHPLQFGKAPLNAVGKDCVLLEMQSDTPSPRRGYQVTSNVDTVTLGEGSGKSYKQRTLAKFSCTEWVQCPDGSFRKLRERPYGVHFAFNGKNPVNKYFQVKQIERVDGNRMWLKEWIG